MIEPRLIDLGYDFRTFCALDAVDWPKRNLFLLTWLVWVTYRDQGLERFVVRRRMRGGKGNMSRRMGVSCGDLEDEGVFDQLIDQWNDVARTTNGQRPVLLIRQTEMSYSHNVLEGHRTGGQKSSCISTTTRAGRKCRFSSEEAMA